MYIKFYRRTFFSSIWKVILFCTLPIFVWQRRYTFWEKRVVRKIRLQMNILKIKICIKFLEIINQSSFPYLPITSFKKYNIDLSCQKILSTVRIYLNKLMFSWKKKKKKIVIVSHFPVLVFLGSFLHLSFPWVWEIKFLKRIFWTLYVKKILQKY